MLERSLILDEKSMWQVEELLGEQYPPRSAANCVQRQIKYALFASQQQRIFDVLRNWGNMGWVSNPRVSIEEKWATSFSVLLTLILIMDKTLETAYYFCEGRIKHHGYEATAERRQFHELVRLMQTELLDKLKEIFHSSFKTRKGGREACNPIRDGAGTAFQRRSVDDASTVDESILRLVEDLQTVVEDFGKQERVRLRSCANIDTPIGAEVRQHRRASPAGGCYSPYTNAGRLAAIFLADFLAYKS
jgi:hypothetical protein